MTSEIGRKRHSQVNYSRPYTEDEEVHGSPKPSIGQSPLPIRHICLLSLGVLLVEILMLIQVPIKWCDVIPWTVRSTE